MIECAGNRFGRQLVLGLEVIVESAMREPGFLHDVRDGNIFQALQSEHPRGRVDNQAAILLRLFLR